MPTGTAQMMDVMCVLIFGFQVPVVNIFFSFRFDMASHQQLNTRAQGL